VSTAQAATATETRTSSTVELRGDVLEVLQALLAEDAAMKVVALVTKLVSRNSELENDWRRYCRAGEKNEGVSSAQLKLFLESLEKLSDEAAGGPEAKAADQKLRDSSASTRRKRSRRSRRSSRRCASRRRRICAASRISFWCRPGNGAARNAARSAIASGTR